MFIPFYKNQKDDLHCFQACLKMALKYFFPEKSFSFKQLDALSKHQKGKWTWQGAALLDLSKMGITAVNIENLDYKKFAQEGKKYLKTIWSQTVFNAQKKYSNLRKEQNIAKHLIKSKSVTLLNRGANFRDVKTFFNKQYIVLVSVNPFRLKNKLGYGSHMAVVTNITKQFVTFHDPGLIPLKNRRVPVKTFAASMQKPAKEDTNVIALIKSKS